MPRRPHRNRSEEPRRPAPASPYATAQAVLMESLQGQLVALKWMEPGWSVRPLRRTFAQWLGDAIADVKGLAWRTDSLYAVE